MRIAFIALLAILAGPIAAATNLTTGSMSCKVKTSYIAEIEEGVAQRFTGYSDLNVGDKINVGYEASSKDTFKVFVTIEDAILSWVEINSSDRKFLSWGDYTQTMMQGRFWNKIIANADSLEAEAKSKVFKHETSYIGLKRYHKDDWHGILKTQSLLNDKIDVFIATLDCRQEKNNLDKFIDAMRQSHNY